MKSLIISLLLTASMLASVEDCGAQSLSAVHLNDEGVNALKRISRPHGYAENATDNDWQSIFDKFESALKLDPSFAVARKNLAVAHNNFALFLASSKQNPTESLKQFHESLFIEPDPSTESCMETVIRGYFKLDPKCFNDRVVLGDRARTDNDVAGAIVEYRAALELKEDPEVRKKLKDVYGLIGDKEKAIQESKPEKTNEK